MRRLIPTPLAAALAIPAGALAAEAGMLKEGKKIAVDRRKGNCLSCHMTEDGITPGNIGPPLVNMKDRFPSKEALRMQIWDATARNPDSPMSPFGRHDIPTEQELERVAAYIRSL